MLKIIAEHIKKFAASALALALLYTSVAVPVAEANLWEQRKAARNSGETRASETHTQLASAAGYIQENFSAGMDNLLPESAKPAMSLPLKQSGLPGKSAGASVRAAVNAGNLPEPLLAVPYSYGEVIKAHQAKNPSAPFILLIQDAHQVEAAQRNIAQTLSHLQTKLGRRLLVGLEGSSGAFDINQYRQLKNPKIQKEIWEVLIQKSLINGAEYFGLMAEREPLLWGVEDEKLYLDNVAAYRNGLEAREKTGPMIEAMSADLAAVKSRILTPELAKLDTLEGKFDKREITLAEYIRFFEGSPELNSGRYPELDKYLSLARVEKDLDFKSVESQRNELIGALTKKLKPADLNQLLQMSVSYRLGRIGYADYYRSLQAMLLNAKIDLKQYKSFNAYVQYVLMSERIDFNSLLDNLESIESAVIRRLAKTPEQKNVFDYASDLRLAGKMTRQELSPEDWKSYQSRKAGIVRLPENIRLLSEIVKTSGKSVAALAVEQPVKNAGRVLNFARSGNDGAQSASAAPVSGALAAGSGSFAQLLSAHEAFYAASHARNVALTDNLSAKIKEQSGGFAVLIAGGFHTPGLEEEMSARGYSYAVFRPRIGKVSGSGTDYLHVFSPNRTPLEKMLLGERLFLMPPSATAARQYPGVVNPRNLMTGAAAPLAAALGAEANDVEAGKANATQIAGAEADVTALGAGTYAVSIEGQGDRTVFLGSEVPSDLADAGPLAFRAGTKNHPVIIITVAKVRRQIFGAAAKVRGWIQGASGFRKSLTTLPPLQPLFIMAFISATLGAVIFFLTGNNDLSVFGAMGLPMAAGVTGDGSIESVPVKITRAQRDEIRFGTAGWRARFPSEKNPNGTFSPDRIRVLMQSAADYMNQNRSSFREAGLTDWRGRPTIVIGYDHRHQGNHPATGEDLSEKAYAEMAARIFAANGIKVKLLSRAASTPLNLYEMWPHEGAKSAMMVNFTASHNPAADGGVEFFDGRTGGLADSPVSNPIVDHLKGIRRVKMLRSDFDLDNHPLVEVIEPSIEKYVDYLINVIGVNPDDIRASGINALFDGQNGVVGGVAQEIIDRLGIGQNVTIINGQADPEFGGRNNSEITAANMEKTMQQIRSEKRDAGVTGDGDFDRSGLMAPKADGSVRLYSGNDLASVQVYGFLKSEKERLGDDFDPAKYVVVRSIVSTSWVDSIAASFGVPQDNIRLTAVGFRFLNNEIRRAKEEGKTVILSFEENGGIALGSALPYKDGLASTLYALTVAARAKQAGNSMEGLFQEADEAARRPDYGRYDVEVDAVKAGVQGSRGLVMQKFEAAQKEFQAAIERGEQPVLGNTGLRVIKTETMDGYYYRLADASGKLVGWVNVRASGTEPLFRIYVETVEETPGSARINQQVYQWGRDIIFAEIGGAKNAHVKTVGDARINEELPEDSDSIGSSVEANIDLASGNLAKRIEDSNLSDPAVMEKVIAEARALTPKVYGAHMNAIDKSVMSRYVANGTTAEVKAGLLQIRNMLFQRGADLALDGMRRSGLVLNYPSEDDSALEAIRKFRENVIVLRKWAEAYARAYKEDSGASEDFVKEFDVEIDVEIASIYDMLLEPNGVIDQIEKNIVDGVTEPNSVHLKLSRNDQNTPSIEKSDGRQAKVGFLPMKGDPWQIGHLAQPLRAMAEQGLDKILVMIDNSDPVRKPDLSSLSVREALTIELMKIASPFVEYTPIAKEEEDLWTADGETSIFRLIQFNRGLNVLWFYFVGGDHRFWEVVRNGVRMPDTVKKITQKMADGLDGYGREGREGEPMGIIFLERTGDEFKQSLTHEDRERAEAGGKIELTLQELRNRSGISEIYNIKPKGVNITSATRVRKQRHWWTVPAPIYFMAQNIQFWDIGAAKRVAAVDPFVNDLADRISSENLADTDVVQSLSRDLRNLSPDMYGPQMNAVDRSLMRRYFDSGSVSAVRAGLLEIRNMLFQRGAELAREGMRRANVMTRRPEEPDDALAAVARVRENLLRSREWALAYAEKYVAANPVPDAESNIWEYDRIVREIENEIYGPLLAAVDKIEANVKSGETDPNAVKIKLSRGDETGASIKTQGGRPGRIGFYPMKGDPWQMGHIALMSIAEHKLDKVVVMIDNSDPTRKPGLSTLSIREAVTLELLKAFEPFIEYSPIAKEEDDLRDADGETSIFRLMSFNRGVNVEWSYMVGSDHRYWEVTKNGNIQPDTTKKLKDKMESKLDGYDGESMGVIFIERAGEEFKPGELQALRDRSGISNIVNVRQMMDTSSTRVRKNAHWWTVPYFVYYMGQSLKFWDIHAAVEVDESSLSWNQDENDGTRPGVLSRLGDILPIVVLALPFVAITALIMQYLGFGGSGTDVSASLGTEQGYLVGGFVGAVGFRDALYQGLGRLRNFVTGRSPVQPELTDLPSVTGILDDLISSGMDRSTAEPLSRHIMNYGLLSLVSGMSVGLEGETQSVVTDKDIQIAIRVVTQGNVALVSPQDAERAAVAVRALQSIISERRERLRQDRSETGFFADSVSFAMTAGTFGSGNPDASRRVAEILIASHEREASVSGVKIGKDWPRAFMAVAAMAGKLLPHALGKDSDFANRIIIARGRRIYSEGYLESVGLEIGDGSLKRTGQMIVDIKGNSAGALAELKQVLRQKISDQRNLGVLSPGLDNLLLALNEGRVRVIHTNDKVLKQVVGGKQVMDLNYGRLYVKGFLEVMQISGRPLILNQGQRVMTDDPSMIDLTGMDLDQIMFVLWYSLSAVFKIKASDALLEDIKANSVILRQA